MEAILQLFVAFVGAICQVFLGILEIFASLLSGAVEFAFLSLTQGTSAAKQRHNERRTARAQQAKTPRAIPDHALGVETPALDQKRLTIVTVVVLATTLFGVIALVVHSQVRKRRIEQTQAQLVKLADNIVDKIKDKDIPDPEPGAMKDLDVWQQPVELLIDKTLVGSLVVVRSTGPDQKPGTADDLLELRTIRASVKEVGGEVAKRGLNALRNRLGALLRRQDKDERDESRRSNDE